MVKDQKEKVIYSDYDIIGPALEIFIKWYNRRETSSNDTVTNSGAGQTASPNTSSSSPDVAKKPDSDPNAGYDKKFTSSSGKTYLEYKQNMGYYSEYDYGGFGTFASYACPMGATSLLLEGYGILADPWEVYTTIGGAYNPASAAAIYAQNKHISVPGTFKQQDFDRNKTIALLKAGHPVAIHNSGWNREGHYMTLLDYNESTGQVYLSAVHTGFNNRGGWVSIDSIGIDQIYYLE